MLLQIAEVFGVDPESFSEAGEERLATDLRAALGDEACAAAGVPPEEIADVARDHPEVARALVALHQRYRGASKRVAALASPEDTAGLLPAEPHNEVRYFFYAHHNHFATLEAEAERTAEALGLARVGRAADALTGRLSQRHGVKVLRAGPERSADARRFDADSGLLLLSPWLSEGQRAFQLGTQLAFLEHGPLLDDLVASAGLASRRRRAWPGSGWPTTSPARPSCRTPAFHTAAEKVHYDIELLQALFGVGFETVCQRLSTLQRPDRRGVPFSFLRADRADNISKRQSATDFHFSRLGGTCPLWTVYEAFSAPGRILTQVAEMPDGKKYFWIARTVTRGEFGHHAPRADFAVALGCELRHAPRLVYAEGVALHDPRATPIGLGCRICERQDCAQRARPPAGGSLAVNPDRRTYVPYPVVTEG
ncbi:short-chain fatty acyl-CoA regulator family protein [Streptomyces erythrochromogenes]|uniref:short-chain fatty acyl-CoA regulator family protein n=1 Tax=Streptomyces erythrochromogenes TaxID=285574 RepID=UPI003439D2DF